MNVMNAIDSVWKKYFISVVSFWGIFIVQLILFKGGLFHKRILTPEPIRPSKPLYQPPLVAEHMPLASGLKPDDLPRKIVGSRVQRSIPEFRESKMFDRQFMLKDAALFMGRSFRVGWGPGGMLVHCGKTISETQKEGTYSSYLSLKIRVTIV